MAPALFGETIFGPIKSRRLGISLGVNLLPVNGKVCSFDCIYCECGYNADHRGGKLPSREDVSQALEKRLIELQEEGVTPDVFTFAGNGEPTMHPEFPAIMEDTFKLRDRYFPNAKISVLSNSTRIHKQEVFDTLNRVDNNILKLDSVFPETVELIDKPNAESFDINRVIKDLARFDGNVIVQTMFLRGVHNGKKVDNTTDEEVDGLLNAYLKIAPKQVMIYSLDRPTPEKNLQKVSKEELEAIAEKFRKAGLNVSVA